MSFFAIKERLSIKTFVYHAVLVGKYHRKIVMSILVNGFGNSYRGHYIQMRYAI